MTTNLERSCESLQPCHLCGGTVFECLRNFDEVDLVKCRICGLICINPFPKNVLNMYASGSSSPFAYYKRCEVADRRTFSFFLDQCSGFLSRGARVLDIGCAAGAFIEVAMRRGFRVEGIELNAECVDWCRSRGFAVKVGMVEDLPIEMTGYDMIHMGDVLEHLSEPIESLKKLYFRLKPGGVVLISTPNFASFAARLFQVKPSEHLFYFTSRTLTKILKQAGFKVVSLRTCDRWRNLGSLDFSSTFAENMWLKSLFGWVRRIFGDRCVMRLPFRENLLALAVRECNVA